MFEFLEMFPLLKFLFNIIDLYIHYFSIVYNIVYIIIIYIIILLLLLIFKNNDVIYYGSNIISKILSFNYIYNSNNIKLIEEYVNSDENVITIMNHRSLFDIIVGLSMFRKLSCIYNKDGPSKIPLFDIINKQS
jgi:1-acyl-sn-glycerol-3-phosphate acyltransferase